MRPYCRLVGWIVGIVIFVLGLSVMDGSTCVDGWRSPSIGRRGACSSHGGVQHHTFAGFVVFYLTLAVSMAAGRLASFGVHGLHEALSRKTVPEPPLTSLHWLMADDPGSSPRLHVCAHCTHTFPLRRGGYDWKTATLDDMKTWTWLDPTVLFPEGWTTGDVPALIRCPQCAHEEDFW